ncbi:YchJ family protein [Terrabacter sp. C0L_2]|uniref:YchJ family protein n=1 Tax=Terrabacter sp. C0L_2 TaxID=3108389 RepID=UPI002ED1DF01|nr:YchJ family metal-binding protein [Terrabacter sp. C0L_2]
MRSYAACCGPLLAGDRTASTAEDLMRSRYTAFATGDDAYLLRTWHPRTRPAHVDLDPVTRWTGLTVLRTQRGGPGDEDGVVEFVARWSEPSGPGGRRRGELHEVSRFERRAGRWLYVDGDHR